ncbi:MAG: ADYC domain-containing protein [Kofleriaceae bacterium]
MSSLRMLLSLGVGLTACAEPTLSSVEQAARCKVSYCGSNSPVLKFAESTTFNMDGLVNDEGFSVVGIVRGEELLSLLVENSTLWGVTATGHRIEARDLIDSLIVIDHTSGEQLLIRIQAVGEQTEVVVADPSPDALPNVLPTYTLRVSKNGNDRIAIGQANFPTPRPIDEEVLCKGDQRTGEWDELVDTNRFESFFFEGDRFHADTITVDPGIQDRWFNIGCPFNTLTKLRLTRSTQKQGASWQQTQATLKMLTANYCGTETLTVPGHPILWKSASMDTFYVQPDSRALEARWNENGPICLVNARYADYRTIRSACGWMEGGIPTCADTDPNTDLNLERELVVSANWD